MVEIRHLEVKDCLAVAEAHINYLKTPFKGNAGIQLLKIRYEAIANQKGGMGFIALEDGKFIGFACGIWDPDMISKSIRKNWGRLIFNGIRHIIQSPRTIFGLIRRSIGPHTANTDKIEGYELRPIVVLPEHRGRGIADQLTMYVLDDAKNKGYRNIYLLTEMDNLRAAKFYTKFGFTFEGEVKVAGYAYKLFRYYFPPSGS